MIKNPNPPSSLGITDFGFNIPWASVLLVLESWSHKQGGGPSSTSLCQQMRLLDSQSKLCTAQLRPLPY